jgi:hypothetical protein
MKRKLVTKSSLLKPRQVIAAQPQPLLAPDWDLSETVDFTDQQIELLIKYQTMQGWQTLHNKETGLEIDIRRRREDLLDIGDVTFFVGSNSIKFFRLSRKGAHGFPGRGPRLEKLGRTYFYNINEWSGTFTNTHHARTEYVPLLRLRYIK